MQLIKSICSNLVFPESRKDIDAFRRMAAYLADKGVKCLEFYHDGNGRFEVGKVLEENGLDGVYIGVLPSKEQRKWLCDTDPSARGAAVDMLKICLEEAQANGMHQVMINSGRIGPNVDGQLAALAESVEEIYSHAEKIDLPLRLLLEPCDSHMDAMHLVGPYARSAAFIEEVRRRGFGLELTMDSAHTAEEGEDFLSALKATRPYCNHIHFANCLISDPANPLYGDKHLGFEYPGTVWSPEALGRLFTGIEDLYRDAEIRIALEVLCREDDAYASFDRMWKSLPFLSGWKN